MTRGKRESRSGGTGRDGMSVTLDKDRSLDSRLRGKVKEFFLPEGENPTLQEALYYHSLGWSIFPLVPGTKKPRVKWKPYQTKRPSPNQIRKWFTDRNGWGIGVALGKGSRGLCCRDFDTQEGYETWAAENEGLASILPTAKTFRGCHVYFISEAVKSNDFKAPDGAHLGEMKGEGRYCVLPPTLHEVSREPYTWKIRPDLHNLILLDDLEAAGLVPFTQPDTIDATRHNRHIQTHTDTQSSSKRALPSDAPSPDSVAQAIQLTLPRNEGERNRKLFQLACHLRYEGGDPKQYRDVLREWYRRAEPKITTKEFEVTWLDFLRGWDNVKYPMGQGPFYTAVSRARDNPSPKPAVLLFPDNKRLQLLVSICRELQKDAGEQPFFLSLRIAAPILDVSHRRVGDYLDLLEREGVVRTIEKGKRKKASTFRYLLEENQ